MNRKLNTSFNDSLIPIFVLRLFIKALKVLLVFNFFSYLFQSLVNIDTLEHFQLSQLRSLLNWRKSFATNSRFTKLCCNIQIKCLLHSNMNGQRFKNIYGAVFTICEGVLNIKNIVSDLEEKPRSWYRENENQPNFLGFKTSPRHFVSLISWKTVFNRRFIYNSNYDAKSIIWNFFAIYSIMDTCFLYNLLAIYYSLRLKMLSMVRKTV